MAGGKETPRQKMIGMMYLVLTALLALNVSKEILNSFIVVNKGLENTNASFAKKTDVLYADFDFQKGLDPVRVTPYWIKAQEAKKQSEELNTYIEQLKKRLIMESEGIDKSVADTLTLANVAGKDNYDTPTHIMIGESEDGSKGVARELKDKLNAYRDKLLGLVDKETRAALNLPINTEDPEGSGSETWETNNFFHSPLAASVTILSKLQNDVKTSESEVVSRLLGNVNRETLKFDTVTAKVIPQSNYVLVGEEYKADVFIAAFSKTQKPVILAGDYDMSSNKFNGKADSLPIDKGQGKFVMRAAREGIIKWGGTIALKSPTGKVLTYPFETEFIAARPALTVSADAMNVMYMGVDNPVSVSVPGIPNEKLRVSISSGQLVPQGNGKFIAKNVQGNTASVSVTATMENGETRNMGAIPFKVKPLPKPYATFVGSSGGKVPLSQLKSGAGLIVKYAPDFVFNITCSVVSYKVDIVSKSMIQDGGSVKGPALSTQQKSMIQNLRKGDALFFTEIKAIGPDGRVQTLPEIGITVQ
jgi:gliding motility-associated protein GldM